MSDVNHDISFWKTENGVNLAYELVAGTSENAPTVVFLCGFLSALSGTKACYFRDECVQNGWPYLRFDYSGHGASSGNFEDGSIGDWSRDTIGLIDAVTEGPLILIGSSMGGWIMLHAVPALNTAKSDRVVALLGIAAAPDFTQDRNRFLTHSQRVTIAQEGRVELPSQYSEQPYVITRKLLEDGDAQSLLHEPVKIDCPVHLIHGMQDSDVPWQTSLKLSERLVSKDVTLTLLKDSQHRLSEPHELEVISDALKKLVNKTGCQ